MKNPRVARRYALALMEAAEDGGVLDKTTSDVDLLSGVLRESRELKLLLASPVVTPAKKTAVLREVFGKILGNVTMTFLLLLVHKGREGTLEEVVEQFGRIRDQKLGIVTVEVKSAVPIDKQHEKVVSDRIERYLGKKVRMQLGTEPSLQGGLVIQIGDHVLDGSVANQLRLLRAKFVAGTARS